MSNPVASILRPLTRSKNEPLNCLYIPTNTEYEELFRKNLVGRLNFYSIRDQQPAWRDYDFIFSQSRISQLPELRQISQQLHLPIISLEHSLLSPNNQIPPESSTDRMIQFHSTGNSANTWGNSNATVLYETLIGKECQTSLKYRTVALSPIAQDQQDLVYQVANNLPLEGHTIINSNSQDEIETAEFYIEMNPYPPSFQRILIAMQAGTVVIAKDSPIMREYVINGVTGFLFNEVSDLAFMRNFDLEQIGNRAKQAYHKFFSQTKYSATVDSLLKQLDNFVYLGY